MFEVLLGFLSRTAVVCAFVRLPLARSPRAVCTCRSRFRCRARCVLCSPCQALTIDTRSRGKAQVIACVICRLRVLGSSGLPVALEAVRPRLNSLALPHEVRECHSLFHMSFTDFVWSRRADWADGRSAFRPASTRCSRPLVSTGSLGMPQLISCVFRRLRVSCGGKIVIRVSGRGASRVVDEWNSKTVTRPWRGGAKKCRLPGHGLVKEKRALMRWGK